MVGVRRVSPGRVSGVGVGVGVGGHLLFSLQPLHLLHQLLHLLPPLLPVYLGLGLPLPLACLELLSLQTALSESPLNRE